MKDSFDVTADIISLINVPDFKALITGDIFSDDRPSGRNLIDVVVNCLGVTNTPMQQGAGNVNVYVPKLSSGRADMITMRRVVKAILPYLDTQFKETFHTDLDEGGEKMQDTDGSWFYNIPINYYSVQTNFKNI